jgi:NAD:arginine ADP-ribosyltransferase
MAALLRIDDVGKEDLNNSLPIRGVWDQHPPLTFESAISHAKVSGIHEDDVVLCKDHFNSIESPPDGMTVDKAAAIRFYTMETPFYSAFNTALRLRDREKSKPFFPYLQLLLLGMHKLPKTTGSVALFRGTRNLPANIIKEYKKKSDQKMCVVWGACSSSTTNESTLFCGTNGSRTKFVIQGCPVGVEIETLSALGIEKEVLLPPCVRFQVVGYVDYGGGLLEFQMVYSKPPWAMIELTPPSAFLSSSSSSSSSPIKGVWDKHPPLTFESAVSYAKVPGIDEDE